MKHLFLALALLPLAQISAQTPLPDSSYIEVIDGVFYRSRLTVDTKGDHHVFRARLGTVAQAFQAEVNELDFKAELLANKAREIFNSRAQIIDMIRESDAAADLMGGLEPLDTLQARNVPPFLAGGWAFRVLGNGAPQNIVFSVTAGGVFRYKIGTATTKNALMFGSHIIVLRDYPTSGEDTAFWKIEPNKYADILRRFTIVKAN